MFNLAYLYLLSPLHTGGTTQEGNLLGIARESHTELPYIPSSTIRGRLRASTPHKDRNRLWGNTIEDVMGGENTNLTQGQVWVGDGSLLWVPVPSLSHGVIWISCPMLLHRWQRLTGQSSGTVAAYSTSLDTSKPVYLKDAILKDDQLKSWEEWQEWIPIREQTQIQQVLVLPDQHCKTLIETSLWRQVKVKLDQHKTVEGGFRYEEAIPPDTLMYFPWGTVAQLNGAAEKVESDLRDVFDSHPILQIGGQESLGRGFVQLVTLGS
ncbi:type III-B CRISPR module RAMP protein Cmr4 [Thermosynechococcus sp. GLH187]|uniref:type III-B CRISPR module RAMP protein Cmr4 n=1 Tax=unclassified Thermosynechococcus TaxID=2622553 RepID=UPI00287807CB|nr:MULTISPECIES: type III-B CRISPR module RAMP protein Cmr4 [unclassified Thermosynechococcus]WNC45222.1 type III-B CRISPR module RAMP protein Cmr4 [Thermosynechococcus sp. GLH187]WNC47758.1 type III-B CRISPR module RAMP protein Cmr4 [Thermosynechococcus sp. GLH333]WNC50294.1 type III-B CRISPR module RAMP protein Cmr4 [Thermosynechococcus sp. GLH87]